MRSIPKLVFAVPCYNEELVLPVANALFVKKIDNLICADAISPDSGVLYVDDGSSDRTWDVISELAESFGCVHGLSLSRNRGHQHALLAGLMEARRIADVVVSLDCDGQDDVNAVDEMLERWKNGAEIVYGVRKSRVTDTWFKRSTAHAFYSLMRWLGAEVVYDHADYRLTSSCVLDELAKFGEVNLFLRGIFPLVGYGTELVYYERHERMAGESHYPFFKMLSFAMDGVTSLSIKPIRLVALLGVVTALLGLAMIVWSIVSYVLGRVVPGWASNVISSCLIGGGATDFSWRDWRICW